MTEERYAAATVPISAVHFLTIRHDDLANRITVDITGCTWLEAQGLLGSAMEYMEACVPEVSIVRDGVELYQEAGEDGGEDDG